MTIIYKFLDKILPKKYFLQILFLFFVFISITTLINCIFLFEIEGPLQSGSLDYIKNNTFLFFFGVVIFMPLIETLFFQWLPVFVYNLLKINNKYDVLIIVLCGSIFGFTHEAGNLAYNFLASVVGAFFIIVAMYYSEKNKNFFLPVFVIHSLNNLIVFILNY